jgi:hypothetical protein
MLWPLTRIVPSDGVRSVAIMRINVVFPAPFGPSSVTTSPAETLRLTSRTAHSVAPFAANARLTPATSSKLSRITSSTI